MLIHNFLPPPLHNNKIHILHPTQRVNLLHQRIPHPPIRSILLNSKIILFQQILPDPETRQLPLNSFLSHIYSRFISSSHQWSNNHLNLFQSIVWFTQFVDMVERVDWLLGDNYRVYSLYIWRWSINFCYSFYFDLQLRFQPL